MRVLITGASGLAGQHLAAACVAAGEEVIGVSRSGVVPPGCDGRALDLRDAAGFAALVADTRPEIVYHLAALSSVGRSWENPAGTVTDNVASSLAVLEALRHHAADTRTVWASTCEVYGPAAELPIVEAAPLQPANPYAVSKATGDMLARVYTEAHGLPIIRARPFNHAGPGQRPIFILSSLAQQGAQARIDGAQEIEIVTGNPDTRRDFTDVRDVVGAYRLLADRGEPGLVYNVCTGRSVSAADQVALLTELLTPIAVEHVVDPSRIRAHEVMDLRGCRDRIREATGWQPEISLRQTMADTIDWWERELRAVAD